MVHNSPGRHPRTAALAAAAILLLAPLTAACGDDGDEAPGITPTEIAPTTARPDGTPTGAAPADAEAAREEIEENWQTFFAPETSVDDKVAVLENGEQLRPVLLGFAANPQARDTSVEITDIAFVSDTRAEVTYDLRVGEQTPLPDARGTAVYQDDVWKVSQQTLCALVKLSGDATAVPGC
ncbi:hypothetical protein [Streptomyces sp. CC228A]|uniref:hypothetical protein n=1 Tax=Streptomyces sp. CC228A TaxID=2898186 RepID=UPI001F277AF4|nr:hypothetical protein [Streptomyces sp. CC228A]